ncbi:aldo/keto reductase [Streptomyces mirabilis]|uniref:aldo/keto reductase n=1 Tax=Streptomyces mirabilis TaxID=68239 RepID=UPI0036843E76
MRGAGRSDLAAGPRLGAAHPLVSAPIVGATKPHHLQQAVDALDLQLSDEEVAALQAPYTNVGPSWF